MEKVWHKSYDANIPSEIDNSQYQSVVEIFSESVKKYGSRPSFSNFGKSITYDELDHYTEQLGAYLQSLGLKKGDAVAIQMPNLLQNPISIFAVLRAGLTVVNVNPLYTPRELQHQLQDSEAKAIIILENFADKLQQVLDQTQIKHIIVTRMGDLLSFPKSAIINLVVKYVKHMVPKYNLPGAVGFKQALEIGRSKSLHEEALNHDDLAFLQYTGGTTGVAKGAELTHGNIVSNVLQAAAWVVPPLDDSGEVVITALPLYHIFSLTANCLLFMRLGGLNYLITNPRDMAGFVKELKGVKFTAITGVNTLFNGLLNTPGFDDIDFSNLKLSLGGGMAVQKPVADAWKKRTQCTLIEAYGLTETSPAACINPMSLQEYNGKIGLPISSTDVCVMSDQGQKLALGESGELCIKGPQVMRGYWKKPEETAKAITDGWFHTGDIAVIDEQGFVQIVDRKKDMILVSGFNVYPNEIEAVVAAHPKVKEVGAVGIPDEKSTEVVKVVVVRKDNSLSEDELKVYCKENLTAYKVPKYIEFREELPKTNVGKILRRALRE